jgi:hypothetical protein
LHQNSAPNGIIIVLQELLQATRRKGVEKWQGRKGLLFAGVTEVCVKMTNYKIDTRDIVLFLPAVGAKAGRVTDIEVS